MLTEDQLLDLFIRQNIPLNGRKVVERIRSSQPVRRVGGGTHNVATRYASQKMGCVIQAESHKSELPNLYLWEHDPNTHEFYDQPSQVKLSYLSKTGKLATHLSTPDYFLIQEDWMGWVECKTEEELLGRHASGDKRFLPDGNGGWRCPPGEAFASEYGLGFKVQSTKETNGILVRNIEFLSDYLQEEAPQPSLKASCIINKHFKNERWVLLQQLLEQEDISADDVFTLIAQKKLYVDLEQELLAEPCFTNVCNDQLSLQVYQHQKMSAGQDIPELHSLLLTPETRLSWDGTLWEIVNVGSCDIFLKNKDKDVQNIPFDAFQKLVARGSITGLQLEPDERLGLAGDKLKQAAPIDLEAAVKRLACLDGTSEESSAVPARTKRQFRKLAREGELAYGDRLAGVLPRISARGNRNRKIDPAVIALVNEVIDKEVLSNLQPKITICYGMLYNLCKEQGLQPPSEKTFRAEIKRRKEEDVALARQGRKAAYAYSEFIWTIDQSTPRHGERPFEVGHIDHTELDVVLIDSRTGAELGKPWLTVLLDAFTRVVIAFFLTFDPPSYRSCMAVIGHAVQRHGRIPKTIVVDHGSDFESTYFEVLLARLVSHKKSRPGSKSRFGSVIERFFGLSNQAFIHNLAGNNQALQKPRSMSPSHDPRALAVWTLPKLTLAFEQFVDGYYANAKHPALGVSPNQFMARGLMLTGAREHTLFPYTDDFRRLCMPTTKAGVATVNPSRGIKINGIFYWTPSFRDPLVAKKKVPVVYDPFDVSRACAYVNGEWVLCRSEHQALFERRSEREITMISQEIRALHKLAEINRNISAADKAAFISQMRESEAILKQQKRDAERSASEHPSHEQPILAEPQCTETEEDLWSNAITFETFEELK